ncbi:AIDA isoform 4 [Pan troglodytes]|uniref:AIDA isoform 4 n=24 Tax=Boreoeutheria TaxID=1437010 RepID=A0A2J8U2G1_PONAB|nr:axin interactor, dorsalization associated [Rhinolophus ferrumequinum]KAI2521513.1 axin interactor, dorsalization associated [Homo sapiens]KAI4085033.1 axin interactor, dorsalization associated [Homo sapiens]PNI31548.1 AIDA isoform 4 [Pan troglodytes]PNJ39452.1 AIDA isoform 4 [Pongo abelii]
MSEVTRSLLQRWGASFRRGADFDSWGQLVEAIDEYQILARHLQKEAQAQHNNSEFTEEQKKTIGKIATCLELRSAALQSTQSQEEFKLEDLKKLEPILKNILTYNKEFPFDVQPVPLRRILAPGEEENLEFEEDEEEGGAGAGSPDSFPARVPGAAIFFEFKHYKPKKRFTSTKCFAFMEMDEIKPGPIVIELYKKPTDFKRKKLQLLTKKPLYLHLHQTLHKE